MRTIRRRPRPERIVARDVPPIERTARLVPNRDRASSIGPAFVRVSVPRLRFLEERASSIQTKGTTT